MATAWVWESRKSWVGILSLTRVAAGEVPSPGEAQFPHLRSDNNARLASVTWFLACGPRARAAASLGKSFEMQMPFMPSRWFWGACKPGNHCCEDQGEWQTASCHKTGLCSRVREGRSWQRTLWCPPVYVIPLVSHGIEKRKETATSLLNYVPVVF